MSWDVIIFNFPSNYSFLDELPEGFEPDPLCSRDEYEAIVFKILPSISKNNDRSWMILEEKDEFINFENEPDNRFLQWRKYRDQV